jgi:hypothetical protein
MHRDRAADRAERCPTEMLRLSGARALFKVRRQVHLQAESPPKVRTERNLQNSRFEPDETEKRAFGRNPAPQVHRTQRRRESRKLKTRWRSGWDSN